MHQAKDFQQQILLGTRTFQRNQNKREKKKKKRKERKKKEKKKFKRPEVLSLECIKVIP